MEARIYYHDGRIETHRLPELVGDDLIPFNINGFGTEESSVPHNDLDSISDIIETFAIGPDGFYLSRAVESPRLFGETKLLSRHRIISADQLADVKLILLDGEQVWPTDQSQDECLSYDDGINAALKALCQ